MLKINCATPMTKKEIVVNNRKHGNNDFDTFLNCIDKCDRLIPKFKNEISQNFVILKNTERKAPKNIMRIKFRRYSQVEAVTSMDRICCSKLDFSRSSESV